MGEGAIDERGSLLPAAWIAAQQAFSEADHQPLGERERLLLGMAQAIREKGFRQSTVADVVRIARTSRRTFYEQFADREDCFLTLVDEMGKVLLARVTLAVDPTRPWQEQIEQAIGAYFASMAQEPALTRSFVFEAPGLGAPGLRRIRATTDRAAAQLTRLVEEARRQDPDLRPLSHEQATALVGGLRELVTLAIEEERDVNELRDVAADLVRRLIRPD